jgi:putative ABC transport system permease protein
VKKRPAPMARRLVERLCWPEDREALLDNLDEEYAVREEQKGAGRARRWYRLQAARCVVPLLGYEFLWRFVMLRNDLKTAFRHYRRHKSFFAIHLVGLAIGMACCLLIMLWVQDEIGYDRFHERLDRIFLVVQFSPERGGSNHSSIPAPLIPRLRSDFPEIRSASRYLDGRRRLFSVGGDTAYEDRGGFADPELFDILSLPALEGDPKAALGELNAIVLTKSLARKYFGQGEALGKVITLEGGYDFVVRAVIKDVPGNSSLRFEYLLPFENFGRFDGVELDSWGRYEQYLGLVLLNDGVDPEAFSGKIGPVLAQHREATGTGTERLRLYPFKNVRLRGFNGDGTLRSVLVFSVIAVLILAIACVNFINLSTAQGASRAREIGLRKVIGANRALIGRQIYTELLVIVASSFVLAILLTEVFLPRLNVLSGKTLALTFRGNPGFLLVLLGVVAFAAILSGTFPVLRLTAFAPLQAMKTGIASRSTRSPLRKSLVIAQFAVSTALIISTVIIGRQMRFIKTLELGFDKSHLLYVSLLGNLESQLDVLKTELLRDPDIRGVTAASTLPQDAFNTAGALDWEGKPADVPGSMNFVSVERDYFRTVGIEFAAGGTFTTTPSNRSLPEFIVNEKAVEILNIRDPLGKSFTMWDRAPGRIIGIVKNVHNAPLHQEIRPVFYVQFPYFYNYLIVNVNTDHLLGAIGHIRKVCRDINPQHPFEYRFLEDSIDRVYQTERKTGELIGAFAVLAILVSCLGLFGLSLFMAEQRTREIGIRKTLGATVPGIVGLMTKDFLQLVAVANLIAWPAAFLVMNKWLGNFAYRITPGILLFLLSGLGVMAIALATVGVQSVKAARADPADSLRYE